jgi:heme/copper-type cytochrome/quinol oxidase subunit 4
MEQAEENESSPFGTLVAILIAIVVVVGAIVAWRASLIDDSSGDYDYAGLKAAVSSEQAKAMNYVNTYADYGNYVNYWRNNQLGKLLQEDIKTAQEGEIETLNLEVKRANDLADSNSNMFKMRYLNRDGTYGVQRQLGELWADAAKKNDLDYETQFAEGNKDRERSRLMLMALMILTVAPIFFTVIESVDKKSNQYILFAFGVLFMLAGSIMAVLVEFKII